MRSLSLALAAIALSAGCAKQWKPLDASVLAKAPGRTIGVVATKPAGFVAHTAVRAMTGLVGYTVMTVAGQQIIDENHIEDPSSAIAIRLMMALAGQYALSPRTPRAISAPAEKLRWDTDLYLQVTTESWAITYFADDWAHYRLRYEASVELHDSRSQSVIASGQCRSLPDNSTGAPTYEEMLDRRAALLKTKLTDAVAACTQKISRELFAIRLPEDRTIDPPVPVAPQKKYASCHLEETPGWKTAGPAEKHRMLDDCWNQRSPSTPQPAQAAPAELIK
jgi:hypothetical protein